MPRIDARKEGRENLVLLAEMRVEHDPNVHPIKVRNLSPSGMMGESALRMVRGSRLTVELPQVGPVSGSVAWVQDERFGVAFDEAMDWRLIPVPGGNEVP